MNQRVLLITTNGHDLTKEAKDKIIDIIYPDVDNVCIVSDPLFVFPKYLRRNVKDDDNVIVFYDSGRFEVFCETDRIKELLKGQKMASWKVLKSKGKKYDPFVVD